MLKVCIFSRAFYPAVGGLEGMAMILAKQIVGFGHEVEIVTDTLRTSMSDDRKFPFKITRTSKFSKRVAAFKQADIVLSMNVTLHGVVAAIVARKPIVFSHQGFYLGRGFLGKFLEFIKKQLTRYYPNISCSKFVADNIPGKSIVVPNTFDSTTFKQPSVSFRDFDFVFCGRLVSDKGVNICIRSFANIRDVVPGSSLTIIGDGPERKNLLELTCKLGIKKAVRFMGVLKGNELVAELQRHTCMIVPSLWDEPFGIVALEGVACCDTVIVSRRGGLAEAVGQCGLVVEPNVEELTSVMMTVVKAKQEGTKLPGEPDWVTRFNHLEYHNPVIVSRKYLTILENTLRH